MLQRVETIESAGGAGGLATLQNVAECPNCIQLQRALQTRDVIATAKGLVMERFDLNDDDAWEALVTVSQTSNIRVHEVATSIIAGHNRDIATRRPSA